ncbi:hypothetical protein IC230_06805 [Spirosoma sp. BT704]|uniref:Polysaccharide deacetylase family protein n=2 Tax=Spirosoma validum TaxID=2771355 RepID=A0A927GCJ4_9BACT|nr:hypothetical protein [Spirosoma validum]
MDFSLKKYQTLLTSLLQAGYDFQTFDCFLKDAIPKTIVLRHDVDRLPEHALRFAELQRGLGITGVYYFRSVPQSWDERIIRKIATLGHEIGYHYECLTTCKGNLSLAIQDFEKNLMALRRLAPVLTVCMHGSPLSRFDSRDLWKTYNYRDFGITGEPYFDVDFTNVLYLTDTGRRWDGEKVSVRDKVNSGFNLVFRQTDDIIQAAQQKALPNQVMFTFHPQRWSDNTFFWLKEATSQRIKNVVKHYFFVR